MSRFRWFFAGLVCGLAYMAAVGLYDLYNDVNHQEHRT
jgi:hypothetical protein